jgi:hypothetical protein
MFEPRQHPAISSYLLAALSSVVALRPLPATIPLVSLLVVVRLATQWMLPRPHSLQRLSLLWASITIGCIISFAGAGSTAIASVFPTLAYSAVFSLLALVPFIVSARLRLHGFEFPTIWSTWWWIISQESPIGRLGIWSPLSIDPTYIWMRPYVGEMGIDWIIGGWAEVFASFVGWYLFGGYQSDEQLHQSDEEPLLIDHAPQETTPLLHQRSNERRRRSIWSYQVFILTGLLVALSIPSSFMSILPPPLHDDGTHDIGVACVLPAPSSESSPFNHFLDETRQVAGRAQVILWPEGAIRFDSLEDRATKLKWAKGNATLNGVWIGISFIEPQPLESEEPQRGKERNGIVLVGKDGVILEYYKRHLVPRELLSISII